jgi:TP901 family phage tail tape measure protein
LEDVNANIHVNLDTTDALASLRRLQAGLSKFNQALTIGNSTAADAQKSLTANLMQSINATGKFVASQETVASSTAAFTTALEKNKLSMRQYARFTAAAATQNSGVFKNMFAQEKQILGRAMRDRVKMVQSQYIQLTQAQDGFVKTLKVMPKSLDMAGNQFTSYATRMQMAAQRQQFLNQLLKQGSTNLLNFGKNTQWAGRQLMVGLTIPLVTLGGAAAKVFREMEEAVIKFTRVYGDMTTGGDATNKAVEDIQRLGKEFTKYGVAAKDTMEMAASAAAMGLTGTALTAQVTAATKLAVLGQVEQQQALETTISLQNAFGISAEQLAQKINFLNAVENQTVLSIEDLTIAIPKAGPVVQQLGGSVEDLAFFMTAMKEGGINASEGANALKSGLASLINPTKKTSEMLAGFGINIKGIVEANAGNLKMTVIGFANALDTLDPLNRARAIEQLFGKFQFARLSTLFSNVTKDSSQAARALGLAGASVEELAILSERELGKVEDAVGIKFQKTLEDLKLQLVPIGKAFLEALTPIVKFAGGILERFNNLSDGTKKIITTIIGVVAGLGPILLMTVGLVANGVANLIKFFALLRGGIAKLNGQNQVLGGGFDYLTNAETENLAISNALHTSHKALIETFSVEAAAATALGNAYRGAATQAQALAASSPGLFNAVPGAAGAVSGFPPKKFAQGGLVPGSGSGDTVPAMLTPGEVVLTKDTVKANPELVKALMSGTVQGFEEGGYVSQVAGRVSTTASFDTQLQKELDRIANLTANELTRYAERVGADTSQGLEKVREDLTREFRELVDGLAEEARQAGVKLTKEKLTSTIGEYDPEAGRSFVGSYAPQKDQNYATTFAHATESENVNALELLKSGQIKNEQTIAELTQLVAAAEKAGIAMPMVGPKSGLGYDLSQRLNTSMKPDQKGADPTEFLDEFAQRGAEKWRKSIKIGGGNFEALETEITNYDLAIQEQVRLWAENNPGKKIKDSDFELIETNVRAGLAKISGGLKEVLDTAAATITEVRVNVNKQARAALTAADPSLDQTVFSGRKKGSGASGQVGPINRSTGVGMSEENAREAGYRVGVASVTGASKGAGTASPSKKTIKTGEEVGDGLVIGMKSKEDDVAAAGGRLGTTATQSAQHAAKKASRGARSTGVITPGSQYDIEKTEGGVTVGTVSKNVPPVETSQVSTLIDKNTALREASTFAVDENGQIIMDPATGAPMTKKVHTKYMRGMRRERVGKVSGKAAGALGTATMVAGMVGAPAGVTGALGAASMLAGIAPALAGMGPFGIAITGLAAAGGGLYMLDKAAEKAAKAQTELANKTQMTGATLKSIGEMTGKVGASQIMERRRQEGTADLYTTNYDRKGQQFGTTFLEGEPGKAMAAGFAENIKIVGKEQAAQQFAANLALAVSDGVMTAVEASDVARQMSIKFSDTTLQPKVVGELNRLIGPYGQDLLKDPLGVRMNLIDDQSEIAKQGTEQLKSMISQANSSGNSKLSAIAQQIPGGQLTQSILSGSATGKGYNFAEAFTQTNAEKAASFGASTGANNVASAQAQLDAFNLQAEKKIQELEVQRSLTTEKSKQAALDIEIAKAQDDQAEGAQKIRDKIGETLQDQIELFRVASERAAVEGAFFDSLKESVKLKYKGTAMEGFTDNMLDKSADLESKELEVTVNTLVASGQVNPLVMTDILDAFTGDEAGLSKILDIGVKTHGADKIAMLINNLGGVKKPELKKKLALAITKGSTKDMDKINATLVQLQTMDQKDFDINVFLGNDPDKALAKLKGLQKQLDAIENVRDPLTKAIQLENKGLSEDVMAGITRNWEYFMSLPETVRKTAIQTYVSAYQTVTEDAINTAIQTKINSARGPGAANLKQYYATAAGRQAVINELAMGATEPQYSPTPPEPEKPKGGPDAGDKGKGSNPLDFLDSLAMRIKNVRDGAFDATKPLASMMAAFSGKAAQKDASKMFSIFDGLQQRMLGLNVPKEFRDMISGMSAEDFTAFSSLPKGKNMFTYKQKDSKGKKLPRTKANITGLTEEGKAVMQTYREAQLGEFQIVQVEMIKTVEEQSKAFNMLISSGLSASEALKVVENEAVAASIAAGTVGEKGSAEMTQFVNDIKRANDALEQQALANDLINKAEDFKLVQQMPDLAKKMKGLKFTAEQMTAVLDNPALMKAMVKDLEDGKLDAKDIAEYLNSIEKQKLVEIKTNFNRGDFAAAAAPGLEIVDEMFAVQEQLIRTGVDTRSTADVNLVRSNEATMKSLQDQLIPYEAQAKTVSDAIETMQRNVEINITRKIEGYQKTIDDTQRKIELQFNRPIQDLQDRSGILSQDLVVMDKAAEAINKRYDEQAAALEKVAQINDDILAQQKQQIGLADALSQGDISQAASMIQEMRAAKAESAARSTQEMLTAARESELGAQRGGVTGLSRTQIEEEQYAISQKIYKLENDPARLQFQKNILAAQDAIYKLEQERTAELEKIRVKEDELYKLNTTTIKPIQDRLAKLGDENTLAQSRIDKLVGEITVLGQNATAWEGVRAKIAASDLASKSFDTALGGLLASSQAITAEWNTIIGKINAYAKAVPGSVTAIVEDINPTVKPTDNPTGSTSKPTDNPTGSTPKPTDKPVVTPTEKPTAAPTKAPVVVKSGDTLSSIAKKNDTTVSALLAANPKLTTDPKYNDGNTIFSGTTIKLPAPTTTAAPTSNYTAASLASKLKGIPMDMLNSGGMVTQYFKVGGIARGADKIPAMLSPGEFIISKPAVENFGVQNLNNINNGTPMGNDVYNYNLSLSVNGTGMDADDVANTVIKRIKQLEGQRVRRTNV